MNQPVSSSGLSHVQCCPESVTGPEIASDIGLSELLPVITANRGEVAFASGDVDAACRYWAEAEPLLTAMGSAHAATVTEMTVKAQCPPAGDR